MFRLSFILQLDGSAPNFYGRFIYIYNVYIYGMLDCCVIFHLIVYTCKAFFSHPVYCIRFPIRNTPDVYGLHLLGLECCPALSNPSLSRGQKVTLFFLSGCFLPRQATPSSSGVWECVRFYDLMTPVGSDRRVGLSVASCEFTFSYAKEGCDSSPGLVVGMEPRFWTLGLLLESSAG